MLWNVYVNILLSVCALTMEISAAAAQQFEAQHSRHHGRRHRLLEHQRLQSRHDGLRTPNIDRIANEGAIFTDYCGQQSCTAGRAAFITGQSHREPAS
jgi:arylsulfatase A-like enzyme